MRARPIAIALLLPLFASCAASPPPDPGYGPSPVGSWVFVARGTDDGGALTGYLDLGRTARAGGWKARATTRLAFAEPRTDPAANVRFDAQEYDQEFDCARGTVRILGVRSYNGVEMVGRGGEVVAGAAMRTGGITADLLTAVCRTTHLVRG